MARDDTNEPVTFHIFGGLPVRVVPNGKDRKKLTADMRAEARRLAKLVKNDLHTVCIPRVNPAFASNLSWALQATGQVEDLIAVMPTFRDGSHDPGARLIYSATANVRAKSEDFKKQVLFLAVPELSPATTSASNASHQSSAQSSYKTAAI